MTATDPRYPDAVWVLVATELLAELGEWSQSVQAHVADEGIGHSPRYEMTFRTVKTEEQLREQWAAEFDQMGDNPGRMETFADQIWHQAAEMLRGGAA